MPAYNDTTTLPTPPGGGNNQMYSFLALGDSYTIGEGVEASARFPAQTVQLLQSLLTFKAPEYVATTGWTTQNLLNAISQKQGTYDVVTLLIGVNDQYQGKDTGGYRTRFTILLERAIQFAGNKKERVFVLSIPDYSVTPFVGPSQKQQVRMEIEWFNDINRQVTGQSGVSYTDITPSTREGANNSALIAGDGLHPSGLEYKKWADMLAPKVKAALQ